MRATDALRERVDTVRDRVRWGRMTDRLGDADAERLRLRAENRLLRDELERHRAERDELMEAIDRLVKAGEQAADVIAGRGRRAIRRVVTLGALGAVGAAAWITGKDRWSGVRREGTRALRRARDRARRRAEVAAHEARELGREAREEVIELRDEAREGLRRVIGS